MQVGDHQDALARQPEGARHAKHNINPGQAGGEGTVGGLQLCDGQDIASSIIAVSSIISTAELPGARSLPISISRGTAKGENMPEPLDPDPARDAGQKLT
ncbi:hypothetical protein [Brevundimonas diminuta]|uniref:hypothetical protein n=1 Tax=Brevundimonas diminuta TaxID=293 RepID=UPI00293E53D0|nr:hypothetical protein [Brevundimonas diminuta]